MAYNPTDYGFSNYTPQSSAPFAPYDLSPISGAADKIFAALAARQARERQEQAAQDPAVQAMLSNFFNPQQAPSLGGPQAGWAPDALKGTAQQSPSLSAVGNNPPVSSPFETPLSQSQPQGKQLMLQALGQGQGGQAPSFSPLASQQQNLQQMDPGALQYMASQARSPLGAQGQGQGQMQQMMGFDPSQLTPEALDRLAQFAPYQAQLEGVREGARSREEVSKLKAETEKQSGVLKASTAGLAEINKQILEGARLRTAIQIAKLNGSFKAKDNLADLQKNYTASLNTVNDIDRNLNALLSGPGAGGAVPGTPLYDQMQQLISMKQHAVQWQAEAEADYRAGQGAVRPGVTSVIRPQVPTPTQGPLTQSPGKGGVFQGVSDAELDARIASAKANKRK